MTESDGGTTGVFVRLSVNILNLFNTDNVHTHIQNLKVDITVLHTTTDS